MKKSSILILSSLFVLMSACRKDNTFDGPSIVELNSTFKLNSVFKASKDSVDFSASETVHFSAQFNKIVTWKLMVHGTQSKAVKVFQGQSKQLDISNTLWNGSTTIFPVFKQELCKAELIIPETHDTFKCDVYAQSSKLNQGLLVTDFESGMNANWTKFIQTGANMDFKIKSDVYAAQGASYLTMAGTVNWDWLIGLIDFVPKAINSSYLVYPLNSNPQTVYFNCLVYGDATVQNPSIILFQFKEDENADGVINANADDEYDLQVKVDWTGWKLVSVRYTDIVTLVNGSPTTPNGNAVHNPDKIGKISMLHLADKTGGFASTKIDYIMFSDNQPIQP